MVKYNPLFDPKFRESVLKGVSDDGPLTSLQEQALSILFTEKLGGMGVSSNDQVNEVLQTPDITTNTCSRCGSRTGKYGRCINTSCSNNY